MQAFVHEQYIQNNNQLHSNTVTQILNGLIENHKKISYKNHFPMSFYVKLNK